MKTKEQVDVILGMHANGLTVRTIARTLGCSPHTVDRYVQLGEWRPRRPVKGKLHGLENWLTERFLHHRGNANLVRQEVLHELEIEVSLRTVERAVAPLRKKLKTDIRVHQDCSSLEPALPVLYRRLQSEEFRI